MKSLASKVSNSMVLTTHNFTMITLRVNSTSAEVFRNNISADVMPLTNFEPAGWNFSLANDWSGNNPILPFISFEEFAIWNRSLGNEEINNLFNNGTGLTLSSGLGGQVSVNLESPINGTATTTTTQNFVCVGNSISEINITNVTFTLYEICECSVGFIPS